MKFYRYIIYRLYTWRLQERDTTPVATIILLMSAIHSFQIMLLGAIITKINHNFVFIFNQPKWLYYLIFFTGTFLYYRVAYNKYKWQAYIQEFEGESAKERRQGTWLVRAFTLGSVVALFISLPILFWNVHQ